MSRLPRRCENTATEVSATETECPVCLDSDCLKYYCERCGCFNETDRCTACREIVEYAEKLSAARSRGNLADALKIAGAMAKKYPGKSEFQSTLAALKRVRETLEAVELAVQEPLEKSKQVRAAQSAIEEAQSAMAMADFPETPQLKRADRIVQHAAESLLGFEKAKRQFLMAFPKAGVAAFLTAVFWAASHLAASLFIFLGSGDESGGISTYNTTRIVAIVIGLLLILRLCAKDTWGVKRPVVILCMVGATFVMTLLSLATGFFLAYWPSMILFALLMAIAVWLMEAGMDLNDSEKDPFREAVRDAAVLFYETRTSRAVAAWGCFLFVLLLAAPAVSTPKRKPADVPLSTTIAKDTTEKPERPRYTWRTRVYDSNKRKKPVAPTEKPAPIKEPPTGIDLAPKPEPEEPIGVPDRKVPPEEVVPEDPPEDDPPITTFDPPNHIDPPSPVEEPEERPVPTPMVRISSGDSDDLWRGDSLSVELRTYNSRVVKKEYRLSPEDDWAEAVDSLVHLYNLPAGPLKLEARSVSRSGSVSETVSETWNVKSAKDIPLTVEITDTTPDEPLVGSSFRVHLKCDRPSNTVNFKYRFRPSTQWEDASGGIAALERVPHGELLMQYGATDSHYKDHSSVYTKIWPKPLEPFEVTGLRIDRDRMHVAVQDNLSGRTYDVKQGGFVRYHKVLRIDVDDRVVILESREKRTKSVKIPYEVVKSFRDDIKAAAREKVAKRARSKSSTSSRIRRKYRSYP